MTSKPKIYRKVIYLVLVIAFTGAFSTYVPRITQAATISELRSRSAELQKEIDAASAQAEQHAHAAATLQEAVNQLDSDIYRIQKSIELTDAKIAQLTEELKAAETELERQKALLAANMTALYKRAGASSVELLVASENFSEFMDQQEYLEKLKSGIQDSAEKVVKLKQQIESNKQEQENLRSEQVRQQQELAVTRSQQKILLDKTRGEEAKYKAIVSNLEAEQRKAEAALAAALSSGSFKTAPVGPVGRGDVIGVVGNTGLSTGRHLHLEVRTGSRAVNPSPYIKHQPVLPTVISQGYGNPSSMYYSGYHSGIDYLPGGGAVYSIDDGYLYRGCSNQMLGTSNNAYGYVAIVQHADGHVSVYAHMSGGPADCNYNTFY